MFLSAARIKSGAFHPNRNLLQLQLKLHVSTTAASKASVYHASRASTQSRTTSTRTMSTESTIHLSPSQHSEYAYAVNNLTQASAQKTSELLQRNHENHHIFFNNSGFHVRFSHSSFQLILVTDVNAEPYSTPPPHPLRPRRGPFLPPSRIHCKRRVPTPCLSSPALRRPSPPRPCHVRVLPRQREKLHLLPGILPVGDAEQGVAGRRARISIQWDAAG